MAASLRSAHPEDSSINADADIHNADEDDEVKPVVDSPESKRIEFLESKIASLQAMNDSLEATLQDTIRRADPKLLLQAEAALQKAHSGAFSPPSYLPNPLTRLTRYRILIPPKRTRLNPRQTRQNRTNALRAPRRNRNRLPRSS